MAASMFFLFCQKLLQLYKPFECIGKKPGRKPTEARCERQLRIVIEKESSRLKGNRKHVILGRHMQLRSFIALSRQCPMSTRELLRPTDIIIQLINLWSLHGGSIGPTCLICSSGFDPQFVSFYKRIHIICCEQFRTIHITEWTSNKNSACI